MNRLIKLPAFIFFIILVIQPVFSSTGGVDFNIRFFDRRIYYVDKEPILVQITIHNQSPQVFRFRLADERAFSLDFDVRNMTNRPVEQSDSLIRRRTTNQQIFFREITLETGESFSFVEDLRHYTNFAQAGSYRVSARIYPELFRSGSLNTAQNTLVSNFLILNLRPPAIPGPDGLPLEMDITTGAVLVRQPMPPDEVVSYMIRARQESQWERYFLYMDLEAMLSRDHIQRRRWLAENEQGRSRMVADYRRSLQSAVVDGDISVIPTSFIIERTVYSGNEGTVTVLKRFRHANFTELRRYNYILERRDNIWMIVDYSVEGMGTVAN